MRICFRQRPFAALWVIGIPIARIEASDAPILTMLSKRGLGVELLKPLKNGEKALEESNMRSRILLGTFLVGMVFIVALFYSTTGQALPTSSQAGNQPIVHPAKNRQSTKLSRPTLLHSTKATSKH